MTPNIGKLNGGTAKMSELKNRKITYYIHCFINLRRDKKDKKQGGAPHKPVLLLAVLQLIENGYIKTNRIYLSPELVSVFNSIWHNLVHSDYSHMIFSLPFYHMKSEPFWRLKAKSGCEKWVEAKSAMKTFANLKAAVDYAEIDNELFLLAQNPVFCNELKLFLLDHYFPDTKPQYPHVIRFADLDIIAKQVIDESEVSYQNRMVELEQSLDENHYQQEVFVRNSIFKREVFRHYRNSCCISELRIDATENITILDACHIVPYAESHNDTIQNGIALCPNLHRAFDRGLIGISDDYRVIVNSIFSEPHPSPYSIIQFSGKPILLPSNPKHYPGLENLRHHRQRFNLCA